MFSLFVLSASVVLTQPVGSEENEIVLYYGNHQQFRFRHGDINILGRFTSEINLQAAEYRLNDGRAVPFFVKGADPEKDKISRNRLNTDGEFNIEIPVSSVDLHEGENTLDIRMTDRKGGKHARTLLFSWNPEPVSLPLDLRDLSQVENIQTIGQVVNGRFAVNPERNVIQTVAPVGSDVLLLLGSPHGSQEATYRVRFGESDAIFLGLSDFFAGHESAVPAIGIKPGWSSAGLATIRPDPEKSAQIWLAWGDLLDSERKWVVKTDPPKPFPVSPGQTYRVRHQVLFEEGVDRARFRIWLEGTREPDEWLCVENDSEIDNTKTKFTEASFGLFQYTGDPTEWSDILVRSID